MQQGAAMAGRYRLVELIGAGGMGEVWRATDAILGRTVAVKVVLPDLHADPEFGRRFLAEARALASVHHPGVVAIHDFGETELSDGSRPQGRAAFLVMEHVAGEPLSALLRRVGRLSPATTMDLVSQTAQALQAVHEHGMVHRDVKPANLLIRPNGAIALTDFGIAINPDATALTKPGMILGTPSYLAPEQVLGQPVSALSDVYALGVVAYECLAGHKPFVADDPFAAALQRVHRPAPPLPAEVPQHVARVVAQALATEPAQRWQTAAEFGLAAGRAIAGTGPAHNPQAGPQTGSQAGPQAGPVAQTPPPAEVERPAQPLPPAAAPPGRRRWRHAVAGAVAVVVLAAGAAALWGNRDRGSADAAAPRPGGTASGGPADVASAGPAGSGLPGGTVPSGGPVASGTPGGGAGPAPTSPANTSPKPTTPPPTAATPYPRTRTSNGTETVGVRMTPSHGSDNPMPDFRLSANIVETAEQPWAYIDMAYYRSPYFQTPSGYITWSLELYTCSGTKIKESAGSETMDFVKGTTRTIDVYMYHGPHYLTARLTSLEVGLTSVPSMAIVTWRGAPITATTPCATLP